MTLWLVSLSPAHPSWTLSVTVSSPQTLRSIHSHGKSYSGLFFLSFSDLQSSAMSSAVRLQELCSLSIYIFSVPSRDRLVFQRAVFHFETETELFKSQNSISKALRVWGEVFSSLLLCCSAGFCCFKYRLFSWFYSSQTVPKGTFLPIAARSWGCSDCVVFCTVTHLA